MFTGGTVSALTAEAKEGDCGVRGIPPQNAKTGGISRGIKAFSVKFGGVKSFDGTCEHFLRAKIYISCVSFLLRKFPAFHVPFCEAPPPLLGMRPYYTLDHGGSYRSGVVTDTA